MSKGLLDVIASSRDEEQPSESLMAALSEKTRKGMTTTMDEQFKLPDLVSPELARGREVALEAERELLKSLPKPAIKPRAYSRTHFDKEKITFGAMIQREQQRQKAEGMLQWDVELELTLEEIEDRAQKEEAKQNQAEQ